MAEDTQTPAKLVELIVLSLVDDPSAVEVIVRDEGHSSIIEVKVAPDDAGKVIGRQGRIAKEIRSLMRSVAQRQGKRISVDIVD